VRLPCVFRPLTSSEDRRDRTWFPPTIWGKRVLVRGTMPLALNLLREALTLSQSLPKVECGFKKIALNMCGTCQKCAWKGNLICPIPKSMKR
jgi:hypothetical protein